MNVKVLVLGLLILTSAIFVDELNIPFLSQVDVSAKKTVEITDMQINKLDSGTVEILVKYKKIGEPEPPAYPPIYMGMSGVAPNGYRYHLTTQNAADLDYWNNVENVADITWGPVGGCERPWGPVYDEVIVSNRDISEEPLDVRTTYCPGPWGFDNRYLMVLEVGYTIDGKDTCSDIKRTSGNDELWNEGIDKDSVAIIVPNTGVFEVKRTLQTELPDNIMDYQITACAYVYQTVDSFEKQYTNYDYKLRSKVGSVTRDYSLPSGTLVGLSARTCNEDPVNNCNNLGSAVIKDSDGNEMGRNEMVNAQIRKEYTLEAIPTGSNEFKYWKCENGCLHFDEDEKKQESEEITITVRGKQTWVAYFTENTAVTNKVTITPIITLNEEFGSVTPEGPVEVVAGEQYTIVIIPGQEYKNKQGTQMIIPYVNSIEIDPERGTTTDIDLTDYGLDPRCDGDLRNYNSDSDCGPTESVTITFNADVDTTINVEFKSFGRQLEPAGCEGDDCPAQPIECRDAGIANYIDKCSVPPTGTSNDNGNIPAEGISSLSKNNLALIGGLVTAFGLFGNGFLPRRLR